jgi:hypothetical protein
MQERNEKPDEAQLSGGHVAPAIQSISQGASHLMVGAAIEGEAEGGAIARRSIVSCFHDRQAVA